MAKSHAVARVLDDGRLECSIVAPRGSTLTLTGNTNDIEPMVEGSAPDLTSNRSLLHNAWAYAKYTHQKVNLPTDEEQTNASKLAQAHRAVAEWIADLADDLTDQEKHGWCSGCFGEHSHRKANRPAGQLQVYLCNYCGAPTLSCACPGCKNMAVSGHGAVRLPRYCAEHRHEIPGFAKSNHKMGALEDYETFLEYDKSNLSRGTKLAGAALAAVPAAAGAAFFAAPAVGGAVGTLVGGYSGAAATSYGLALLGGGAVAAGGLGMAGGTLVIAALGGALGGVLGASVMNAYVREDKSFHIEMLRGGQGVPVVVCNGFLSQSGRGWGEWKDIVTQRYPDSPVYRVHWGAKELKNLGFLFGGGAAKVAGVGALKQAAAKAARTGAEKLGPLGPTLFAADLAKNPWHVAKNRADKTGVIVADLLARTDADSYVLVGHSLGARAMVVAAQTLGSKGDGPRIHAAHLLGAAIGAKSDWRTLTGAVDDAVYNYHSTNDKILKYFYRVAQAGQTAAGLTGFTPSVHKLNNIDVSAQVPSHSDYHTNVHLV